VCNSDHRDETTVAVINLLAVRLTCVTSNILFTSIACLAMIIFVEDLVG